jgi:hypothetical protein
MSAKKAQITQERVEYKVFCSTSPPKVSKWLKIFKITLTFRFDKLSNSSKSVHTGENSPNSDSVEQKNKVYTYFKPLKLLIFLNLYKIKLKILSPSGFRNSSTHKGNNVIILGLHSYSFRFLTKI